MPNGTTVVRTLDAGQSVGAVGWLEIESSAVCGTDITMYRAGLASPTVLGHHVVGTITSLDPGHAEAWGVIVGDRVALEEYLPCLRPECCACRTGCYRMCPETDLWSGRRRVGLISAAQGSGLYGGNAEFMQLTANSILHKLPDELDSNLAAWTQPFANAIDWTIDAGGARSGSTVVVIGPGYHGIAAVAAARAADAERIVVIGLPEDSGRLEIAEAMGATPVVSKDGNLTELILRSTGGLGADVILDTVGLGAVAVSAAAGSLRKFGRLVVGGLGSAPLCDLDLASLVRGANAIVGVRGRSPQAVARSVDILASGRSGLDIVSTVGIALEEIDAVFAAVAEGRGPTSPHLVVRPRLGVGAHQLQRRDI